MASVNRVTILGRLGRDPEMRYLNTGTAVCNFSVATSEKDQDQEKTEWHRIVAFKKTAELCGQYLQKGSQVYLEGKIQTREWQDKDGNNRYTTEIVAFSVQFLDSKGGGQQSGPLNKPGNGGYASDEAAGHDDDIPF